LLTLETITVSSRTTPYVVANKPAAVSASERHKRNVYPYPTAGEIFINAPNEYKNVRLTIFNFEGR